MANKIIGGCVRTPCLDAFLQVRPLNQEPFVCWESRVHPSSNHVDHRMREATTPSISSLVLRVKRPSSVAQGLWFQAPSLASYVIFLFSFKNAIPILHRTWKRKLVPRIRESLSCSCIVNLGTKHSYFVNLRKWPWTIWEIPYHPQESYVWTLHSSVSERKGMGVEN